MTRPLSNDLRERVVAAVLRGASCREAAARFDVAVSSVVKLMQRYRATGSVVPGKMGGHRKRVLLPHRDFIQQRLQETPHFSLKRAEGGARRARSARLAQCGVGVPAARRLALQKKRSSLSNRRAPTLRVAASDGSCGEQALTQGSSSSSQAMQEKRFGAILADPPWRFQNRTGKVAPGHRRLNRYETLTLQDIMALPVSRIAADTSHLYMWTPNALLPEALDVMKAWGFTYKSNIVWHKIRKDGGPDGRGIGFYFRNVTALRLFGVRGKNARTLPPAAVR